jgi:hypothetical protein
MHTQSAGAFATEQKPLCCPVQNVKFVAAINQ